MSTKSLSTMTYALLGFSMVALVGLMVVLSQMNSYLTVDESLFHHHRDETVGTGAGVAAGASASSNRYAQKLLDLSTPKNLSKHVVEHLRQNHDIGVDGIDDTVTAMVECTTTKGNIIIDVRGAWAPLGSEQFLKLVDKEFFTDLPFFRVCPRYITQFGAKYGRPRWNDVSVIRDDPPLWGKRDMDFGYVFFAGSGPNSRYNEMVIALCEMKGCKTTGLGAAPWEVPIGTIRKEGFGALHGIEATGFPYPKLEMGGQHPKAAGPDRVKLDNDPEYLKKEYPDIAYFKSCRVLARNQHKYRPLSEDHPDTDHFHVKDSVIEDSNSNSNSNSARAKTDQQKLQLLPVVGSKGSTGDYDSFYVLFKIATTQGEGDVVFQIIRSWAPLGADRFKMLVENHYFDGLKFFRVIQKFMAQFGMHGDPKVNHEWNKKEIRDDPVKHSNSRGTLSFACSGPNTRSTQLFVNLVDNRYLDNMFAPIGQIISGMQHIDLIYDGYGEGGRGDGTDGKGPSQGRISQEGNAYLDKVFPKLSTIISVRIVDPFEVKKSQ